MTPTLPAGPLYMVIAGRLDPYNRERNLKDMDRATTVRHIAEGQFDAPFRVIGFNLERGDAWDATPGIMAEAQNLRADKAEGDTPTRPGIAERWDVERAARGMV